MHDFLFQVKEHEQSLKGTKSLEQHAGNQIVRNVAEMAGTFVCFCFYILSLMSLICLLMLISGAI